MSKGKKATKSPKSEERAPKPDPVKTEEREEFASSDAVEGGDITEDPAKETEICVEEPSRESVLEDRLVRLQADFDNFRKRTLREREDLYRRANEDILSELLPVLDHLDLALQAAGEDAKANPTVKGFALVGEQLQKTLQKFGLVEIPTDDVEFDPNVHEAIQHLPSDVVPENGIIARPRAGYMLGTRLLRAAQVVVSSGPADGSQET